MHRVGICGHFAIGRELLDGQTIKTKTLTEALQDHFGIANVMSVDTYNWKASPFRLLRYCLSIFRKTTTVVMLPGRNGLKIFVPLFVFLNKVFKRKMFYVVIGGWLPEFLKHNKSLLRGLKHFDCIFVETESMAEKLKELGLDNVSVMPNFKRLKILSINELPSHDAKPFKLCTFSRVLKEKGIEDAINAVIKTNSIYGKEVYTLDIYGQIDEEYKREFQDIIASAPSYIKYKGMVPYSKTVDTLKDYFLLLFPTYYKGEGFAGTALDAFASGLPIIATDWRYNSEVIEDQYTGRILPVKDVDSIIDVLNYYEKNPDEVEVMRRNCIDTAFKYTPSNAIKILVNKMNS
ncbi:glycosyltransferase family 4 protein [Bhargavaea massiliensis]|uniref:glycosyltransferase family 4 protein n=1 Tax=Bhargavaea massiliensis TaxID=2697500 RepID=UPI001BCB2190|nr:glycosyltransferase family 4 protein [Bhargavaea massiliensis]